MEEIDAILVGLVDRVASRLRKAARVGRTVVLRLRFDDFSRATRSYTLPYPTAETQAVLDALRGLLAAALPTIERRGLTLIGVAVANLEHGRAIQLSLPLDGYAGGSLDAALDEVRERFGSKAVLRAVLLGRDEGLARPCSPTEAHQRPFSATQIRVDPDVLRGAPAVSWLCQPRETNVTALVAPSESLSERVDGLVRSHSDAWPPLHSSTTAGAIAEIIAHIDGLEEAIHAMAQEIQRLAAERDRLEAHAMDD